MSEENKKNSKQLKYYHFIILSCVLCIIFIINSNHVNKKRFLNKLNQVKNGIYENIKTLRNLQDFSINYSNIVCSKASDDLIEYYKTGDLSKIDIDSDEITCEDKDKSYMKNLIAIVKNIGGDDNDNEANSLQESAIDYGKSFIPMIIFLSFGLFGILGWPICCICACCNCCCCCCCKKPQCKKVCFIFTYVFYAGVVGVSIFGLAVTNKAFRGLNDTGCSFLKFFDQVLYGEIDQNKIPRWSGANNIKDILLNLKYNIENSGNVIHNNIKQSFDDLNESDTKFLSYMKSSSQNLYSYSLGNYSKLYDNGLYNSLYILDIVYSYGKDLGDSFTNSSILDNWSKEYHLIGDNAKSYIYTANDAFNDILDKNLGDVVDKLDKGAQNINKITKPFNELNEDLGKIFDELSTIGENFGKMSLHTIFTILMVMNFILAGFILLICFCSMKQCTSCCCCRCLFKCVVHLSWNMLALMMISSFLFGSLLGIFGIIGGDMMSLVSYILSEDNFNNQINPLFIDKFGDAKEYLKIFIHHDGDISSVLKLNDSLTSFNDINDFTDNIGDIKSNFNEVISHCIVYNNAIELLKNKTEFLNDPQLIPLNENHEYVSSKDNISYYDLIKKINNTCTYKWAFETNGNSHPCDINTPRGTVFNVKDCKPKEIIEMLYPTDLIENNNLLLYSSILDDIDTYINNANSNGNVEPTSFKEILDKMEKLYSDYLLKIYRTLDIFNNTIYELMREIKPLIGNKNNFFSFLNGHFIKTNVQIILKNLKNAFGKNIFSIGLSLNIVGCALILSISSTLILLAIINEELKQNIKIENTPGLSSSEMPFNKVSPFGAQNILPA